MNPARMMVVASVQKQLRRIRQTLAKITEPCGMHPEGATHECMQGEMRCAYCGVRLALIPEYERRRSEP